MSNFTPATVAETVAETLNWAARQASSPVFTNIVGMDTGEIELTINLPGDPEHYRLIVERIGERS